MVMKVLNVAEKNDSAKHIAEIMSRGRFNRRDSLSVYNKIYEFPYQVQGVPANMIMTSVSGHLLGLEFHQQYRKWTSCHPQQLFDLPVSKSCKEENMINIKKSLEKEVRGAQMLIIWTDCDREGENIGMEIVDVCRSLNRNIRVLRAKFSEITRPSIERAMATLGEISVETSNAVDCRIELDLRIGAAFTRFQTLRLQKVFPGSLSNKLISYGSCQFPTMGFVVERFKEIESFIPESFWKIKVIHEVEDIKVDFLWKRCRLFDENIVQMYHEICMEESTARVEDCISKPKSKWRPLPLDTVELQKIGNRKLRMSAKSIMTAAEKLYTQGFISYPRTETNIFPKELDLAPLVQAQTNDQRWGGFAGKILTEFGGPHPRVGKKTDEAHPPIHPTKYSNSLNGDEAVVYEFIVRHFLAGCSRDAVGKETTVQIDINGEKFVGHGLTVCQRNYLEVYIYEKWSDKEILDYEEIREFEPTSIDIVSGSTEPPKLLTEADLIALMDENGIGTDATHAEHIETIKAREYVFVENRDKLVPGKLGMALVEGYDSMGIGMSKPFMRAGLESDLKLICEGVKTKEEVLEDQIARYKEIFMISMENAVNLDAATHYFLEEQPAQDIPLDEGLPGLDLPDPVVPCSNCGSFLVLKRKQSGGWMISCQGYPACKQAIWLPDSVLEAKVDAQCDVCPGNPTTLSLSIKRGTLRPFYPDEFVACLGGCDTDLLNMMDIQKLNGGRIQPAIANPAGRGRGRGGNQHFDQGPPRAGGGGGPGGGDGGFGGGRGQGGGGQGQGGGRGRGSSTNDTGGGAGLRGRGATGSGPVRPPRGAPRERGAGTRGRGRGKDLTRNNDSGYQSGGSFNQFQSSGPSQETSQDQVTCQCGAPAIVLTVRKEGPNQGREFYKCESGNCNFFSWADEAIASSFTASANLDVINCDCGQPSIQRTVQKDGPNKGRDFLCCSKGRDEQCRFFQWTDEVEQGGSQAQGGSGGGGGYGGGATGRGGGRGGSSSRGGDGGGESGDSQCECGIPCVRRTVRKDGPNKDRDFLVCSNQQGSQCGTFIWADEIDNGGGAGGSSGWGGGGAGASSGRGGGGAGASSGWGGGSGGGGRGQGGGRGRGRGAGPVDDLFSGSMKRKVPGPADGTRKPRACGLCKQTGHTRKKCPLNQNDDGSYG